MRGALVRAGFVAAALVASAAGQVTTVSTGSGDWNAAATWSNGVPGPLDTAVIGAGHQVWLATAGVPANPIVTVDTIDVAGTLISDNSAGQSMTLQVGTLKVQPTGVVRGQNGGGAPGGTVRVEPAIPGLPLVVNNDGQILGGNGVCGGHVLIYGNDPGSDLAAPNTTITSTGGLFRAGDSGGSVWMAAGQVTLNNATVLGGNITAAGPQCGRGALTGFSVAGSVYISAIDCDLNGTTLTQGGDDLTGGPGVGGTVFIRALNDLFVEAGASVLGGGPGTGACPGVLIFAAGTSTILGTVSPSPGAGCIVWDPPTLQAVGDMNIDASEVHIGGETLDATALNAASAPHITASSFIEINLSPGGVLDLSGLTPGVAYFDAPQIFVNADVATEPGFGIERFVRGQVIVGSPTVWRDIAINPGAIFYGAPGETVVFPVQASNVGAQTETVELNVTDSMGWMTPVNDLRTLPEGFTIYKIVEVPIPGFAAPGDFTIVHAVAQTTDAVLSEEAGWTVEVLAGAPGGPCNPADLAQPFGVLDLGDVNAFVTAFVSGDTDIGDLDGNGVLDLTDIGLFVGAFVAGCP